MEKTENNVTSAALINSMLNDSYQRLHEGYENVREGKPVHRRFGHSLMTVEDLSQEVHTILNDKNIDQKLFLALNRKIQHNKKLENSKNASEFLYKTTVEKWNRARSKKENSADKSLTKRTYELVQLETLANLGKGSKTHAVAKKVLGNLYDDSPQRYSRTLHPKFVQTTDRQRTSRSKVTFA